MPVPALGTFFRGLRSWRDSDAFLRHRSCRVTCLADSLVRCGIFSARTRGAFAALERSGAVFLELLKHDRCGETAGGCAAQRSNGDVVDYLKVNFMEVRKGGENERGGGEGGKREKKERGGKEGESNEGGEKERREKGKGKKVKGLRG